MNSANVELLAYGLVSIIPVLGLVSVSDYYNVSPVFPISDRDHALAGNSQQK